jgi:mycothione reductase
VEHYDLAIIGSGSGNSVVTADFQDKRVAIIESGVFGGTCLNVGCIPTKMLVHTADVAATVSDAGRFGVDAALAGVRWPEVRDRIFGRIDPISAAGRDFRVRGPNTTAYLGRARFIGPRRLRVDRVSAEPAELTAEQVVIATGSHPVAPRVIAESGVPYHTSDTVMRVAQLPGRLVIVGGGYIACEFAHVFGALGATVTIVARGSRLLRHLDDDISTRFTDLALRRWDVRLGAQVTSLTGDGRGVALRLDDGSALSADLLLVATGRAPTTADLGLDAAGVARHPDGRVAVDRHGRTSAAGVWALGDVSSPYQLKHVANHEARVVAHNVTHPEDLRSVDHRVVPFAVFSHPQIASVGQTEQQLAASGARYVSAVQRYGDTAYGWAMEDADGICKVLADPDDGRLLGVHALGAHASTLIQPAIQAMTFGQRAGEVARGQYWIHPALSEVLENALLGVVRG